jgi:hypothetical protein
MSDEVVIVNSHAASGLHTLTNLFLTYSYELGTSVLLRQ